MIQNGEMTLADAKRVLRRHWWIVVASVIALTAIALVLTFVLPKRYTSTTVVLVQEPTVGDSYVPPPVMNEDLNNRLASMKQQILSRSHLEPIIEQFGLYPEERKKLSMDDLVDKLRLAIDVGLTDTLTQSHQPSGFHVSVTFNDPKLAQQICTEITTMFVKQNVYVIETQAKQTTNFLNEQLNDAKAKLDAQDAMLAQFKRQYLGSLPDEEQANLGMLTGVNSQLQANMEALSRMEEDKTFNESLLSAQENSWKASQTQTELGQSPDSQARQLGALQDQLAILLTRYTPEYPDVIKLKSQIAEIQRRMANAPSAAPSSDVKPNTEQEPAQIQQLRAKIRQDDVAIADLTKQQAKIQEQIQVLQSHVQQSPVVEEQYKELTRDHQSALDFYNDLLKKRDNSAMATDLQREQQGETFRVLDPPSLPDRPSFPKKSLFAGGGFGAGLMVGLGILYLLAISDKSFHTEGEIEQFLKLPVLTAVPLLEGIRSPVRKAEWAGQMQRGFARDAEFAARKD
jgi:polysaccharide chain length determinant protein (PEP-CTERM system associated)